MGRDFRRTRRAAITLRLFIYTAVLSILPSGITAYFAYTEAKRDIIDEKVADMKQISKLRMESVTDKLVGLKDFAVNLTSAKVVGRAIERGEYEQFTEHFFERIQRGGFVSVALLGADGKLLASTDPAAAAFYTRTQWRNTLAGAVFAKISEGAQFAVSDLTVDTPTGEKGIVFAVPVKNANGKTAAVLELFPDLAKLRDGVAAEAKNFKSAELFICSYIDNSPFIIEGANADGAVEPAFMGVLAKTLEGAKISPDYKDSGYSLARDYRGATVVAAWDYIPLLDWYVIMKTDLDEVLVGIRHLRTGLAAAFALVALVSLLVCAVFSKIFTMPVRALLKRIPSYSAADTLWDAPKSEPQVLALSIDSMKDAIGNISAKTNAGAAEILESSERLALDTSARAEISRRMENSSEKIILHSRKISEESVNLEHSVEHVDGVAEISVRQAEAALEGIGKMNSMMSELEACAGDFSNSLSEIFAAGRKIGEIVNAMTQLADRANLLSLNASIEAKKAGADGSGFAVVADRLRKLADQTSTSTLEIENIVRTISELSETGAKKVGDFNANFADVSAQTKSVSDTLSEIIQRIQAIPPRLVLLLDGIRTQSGESREIGTFARRLKKAAEEESKLIESARQIAENLSKTASNLRRNRF